MSDHPNPGNRRAAIQKEIGEWPPRQYTGDSAEYASVRKQAAGVQAYSAQEIADGAKSGRWAAENRRNGYQVPDQAAGAVSGSPGGAATPADAAGVRSVSVAEVQPSSNFRSTNLGAVRIDRPENWEVIGAEQSSATIAPRAGVSQAAVAYGVVIRSGQAPSANLSASRLTAAIVQNLQNSDRDMRQVGDIQPISVGGNSAGSVELETISPMPGRDGKPQRERDWLVAVPRGRSGAIFFVFVSPLADRDQLRPAFERMLRSVQF
jgi:hypothetical protein